MKLLKMKLENFKGVRELEIVPNGRSIDIAGDNGTGKTTVADAFSWLLFDKASDGGTNFSPKTQDGSGGFLHDLEHSVSASVELSGVTRELKKIFREKWQTKGLQKTLTGHTTDYFVDGVPSTKREYDGLIAAIVDAERARILTQPLWFSDGLHWTERRKILSELAGDILDDEINAAAAENLEPLFTAMGTFTVEQFEKIAKAKHKELAAALKTLPERIDEASRALPDVSTLNEDETKEKLFRLTQQRSKLKEAEFFGDDGAMRAALLAAKEKFAAAEDEHRKEWKQAGADIQERLKEVTDRLKTASTAKFAAAEEVSNLQFELDRTAKMREQKLAEYAEENERKYSGADTCPFCEQRLPDEQVEAAQAKFNAEKSDKLKALRTYAEQYCSKGIIESLRSKITAQNDIYEANTAEADKLKMQMLELESAMPELTPFEKTDKAIRLKAAIDELEMNKETAAEKIRAENAEKLANMENEISALERDNSMFAIRHTQQKRIDELRKQQSDTAKEHEQYSLYLHLLSLRSAAYAELVTEKVNKLFKRTKFTMFKQLVNGDLEQICETTPQTNKGYIDWNTANNAAKVNSGLDIIHTLGEHWGVALPVFFDNAESVTELEDCGLQVIRLIVDKQYKQLTVLN